MILNVFSNPGNTFHPVSFNLLLIPLSLFPTSHVLLVLKSEQTWRPRSDGRDLHHLHACLCRSRCVQRYFTLSYSALQCVFFITVFDLGMLKKVEVIGLLSPDYPPANIIHCHLEPNSLLGMW